MDNASIITETPQRKGLSLKWKWALGSAAGVFLIFIIFAWFVVQAFSSQMLKTERQQSGNLTTGCHNAIAKSG